MTRGTTVVVTVMGASTSKREAGEGFLEQQVKKVTFSLRTRGLLCRHKYAISKLYSNRGHQITKQRHDYTPISYRKGNRANITFATALASSS